MFIDKIFRRNKKAFDQTAVNSRDERLPQPTIYFYKQVWLSVIILLFIGGGWISLYTMPEFWRTVVDNDKIAYKIALDVTYGLLFVVSYSVIVTIIDVLFTRLITAQDQQWLSIFIPVRRGLKMALFLLLLKEALSFFSVPAAWLNNLHQFNQVIIIAAVGWCLFQCIQAGEAIFIQHNRTHLKDALSARRAYTHVAIIKRIMVMLLVVFTTAAMLMSFERIRSAGTAILASAGVMATIVGFSAKGLLESIFKGLQLAFAQPIRLNDTVTINGETGTVTEITLNHVVVTLGDRSQVIVPTGDFLDKTFKNWTHCSDDLLGNVLFYVNYNMPIEPVRKKFHEILNASECWDQGIGSLDVSDFKNRLVELKLVMSAKSGRHLANLRNEVREKLLEYMQTQHAEGLPA